MELTIKEKILLAMYQEQQKDLPNMGTAITADKLNIKLEEYLHAIDMLIYDRLIDKVRVNRGADNKLLYAIMENAIVTMQGKSYCTQNILKKSEILVPSYVDDQYKILVESNDKIESSSINSVIVELKKYGWTLAAKAVDDKNTLFILKK